MITFVKLFGEILDSSVWQLPAATRIVWITMLAMKDRDHVVRAAVPGLAARARVSLKECEAALAELLAPDKYSRSKVEGGRRILEVQGGWFIVNGEEYRNRMSLEDRREYQRVKQAEYRAARDGKKSPKDGKRQKDAAGRERRFVKAEAEGNQAAADEIAAEGIPESEPQEPEFKI